jgi:hypothetical protein
VLSALFIALLAAGASGMPPLTHAQTTPFPTVLTMSGPATAVSGQEITYRVHYRLTDPATIPQAAFHIIIPQNTTYVSSQVVSGPPGILDGHTEAFVRWGGLGNVQEPEGDVELTGTVGAGFVGQLTGGCYVPGTETGNPESRCSLETQVSALSTAAEEDDDSGSAARWLYVSLVVLGLVAAGIGGVVLVRRISRRAT